MGIVNLLGTLFRIAPGFKGLLWRTWYQFLARTYPRTDWTFMNYGYAPVDNASEGLELQSVDGPNQYCIQLYHHIASGVDLTGLDVVEVGSGRGGGADYIKRYLKPKTMVGIDLSENAIAFCRRRFTHDAQLTFQVGNAEALPCDDESVDVVINVESSHCYPSMVNFLTEVKRVLRRGGYFLFTDFRSSNEMEDLIKTLDQSGLIRVQQIDINPNILRAMELDHARKLTLIQQAIHRPLQPLFLEFAGIQGSSIYQKFQNRETVYYSFVLQKSSV
ncbi:MAG: class I SAM-dependent methyltransferase [Merismopedia sp. SIO2A8]|nr:class I SAM-dependent methyltransferase [Merismopedia sp. SIO2A8]